MFLKLPVRKKIIFDESIDSFIRRLADANHIETSSFFAMIGISKNTFKERINNNCLQRLSELSGVEVEKLRKLTFLDIFEGNNKEIDNLVKMKGVYLLKAKICPKCVQEYKYIRKVWAIGLYTVCHIHNILMVEKCPSCNGTLYSNFDSMTECKCGYKLTKGDSKEIEFRSLEKFLYNKLLGFNTEIECFNSLSFSNCLYILIVFSTIVNKLSFSGTVKFTSVENNDIEVFQKAMDLFFNWPLNFMNFIDLYNKTSLGINSHHSGVNKDFGYLYLRLVSKLKSKQFSFIRFEFDNYLINRWEGGLIPASNKELRLNSKFITGEKAAELLKVSHVTIVSLIERQLLVGAVNKRERRMQVLVEKKSVTTYLASIQNMLSASEVICLLGICRDSIHKLQSNDIIQGEKHLLNKKAWAFQRNSVEGLLNNFEKRVLMKGEKQPTDLYNFSSALDQFVSTNSRTIVDLIKAVLDSKLAIYKIDVCKGDLNSYYFSKRETIDYLNRTREGLLNRKEVATALKTDANNIGYWIKLGFLEGSAEHYKIVVSTESINNFIRKYIDLGEISRLMKRQPRWVLEYLQESGVVALSGKKIDGSGTYLFNRNEIFERFRDLIEPILSTDITV
ncbi:TniQ family protein [Paenibacillus sp. CGMCC 1.16610]|uniref:TniQ family protein n=1 Tax=Paenibacillus TaxID=44249 RepID=UPI0012F92004|nr:MULTISPECIES: TniQ family protein [Paenibacillus]MBA2939826.1 TniQ family protein [Paenibacillus sp. CGMCC 1.16610]